MQTQKVIDHLVVMLNNRSNLEVDLENFIETLQKGVDTEEANTIFQDRGWRRIGTGGGNTAWGKDYLIHYMWITDEDGMGLPESLHSEGLLGLYFNENSSTYISVKGTVINLIDLADTLIVNSL